MSDVESFELPGVASLEFVSDTLAILPKYLNQRSARAFESKAVNVGDAALDDLLVADKTSKETTVTLPIKGCEFKDLPFELRSQIWKLVAESSDPKLIKVQMRACSFGQSFVDPPMDITSTAPVNVALQVCKESREIAETIFVRLPKSKEFYSEDVVPMPGDEPSIRVNWLVDTLVFTTSQFKAHDGIHLPAAMTWLNRFRVYNDPETTIYKNGSEFGAVRHLAIPAQWSSSLFYGCYPVINRDLLELADRIGWDSLIYYICMGEPDLKTISLTRRDCYFDEATRTDKYYLAPTQYTLPEDQVYSAQLRYNLQLFNGPFRGRPRVEKQWLEHVKACEAAAKERGETWNPPALQLVNPVERL